MNRRTICALLIGAAVPLQAQVGRFPRSSAEPGYWVGLSYGYVDGITLSDEATSSTWQFSYTSQLRATLEKTVQRGVTIGASAGFSSGNLEYRGAALNNPCGLACSASADVSQYMGFLRGGGGLGFHGVYSLEAGVTRFSNFRERSSGNELPPTSVKNDFTFGFGGAFEYGFSPIAAAYVGEQVDLVLHHQSEGSSGSAPRLMAFRVGFRMGF